MDHSPPNGGNYRTGHRHLHLHWWLYWLLLGYRHRCRRESRHGFRFLTIDGADWWCDIWMTMLVWWSIEGFFHVWLVGIRLVDGGIGNGRKNADCCLE